MAITQADEGTFADMEPMVEEGICTFKVFLAYKGVLMVTDDLFFRVLDHTRDLGALTMVHCENGWVIDVLVERALAAGQTDPIYHALTRPESVEAEATNRSVRLAELAAAARGSQPGAAVGRARPRRARERLHRPLPVQQRAEGTRSRRLLEDPQRARDDPAPAGETLGPRRRDGADHARGAGRHDLDRDRKPLRPRPQGRCRTR